MATKRPLVADGTIGTPREIATGDTIDPVYIPSTAAPTQRTFAFFIG